MAGYDGLVNEPSNDDLSANKFSADGCTRAIARLQVENQQLRIELTQALQAMAAREVIEQAKGLLMGHYRCSPEAAFEVLREVSQRANVKLRDLALGLTERARREGRVHFPGLDEAAILVLGGGPRGVPDQQPDDGPAGWR